jgi:hypothetical protein
MPIFFLKDNKAQTMMINCPGFPKMRTFSSYLRKIPGQPGMSESPVRVNGLIFKVVEKNLKACFP